MRRASGPLLALALLCFPHATVAVIHHIANAIHSAKTHVYNKASDALNAAKGAAEDAHASAVDAYHDAKGAVVDAHQAAVGAVSDGYASTNAWVSGTWDEVKCAATDAKERVHAAKAQLEQSVVHVVADNTWKAKMLWKRAFMTCDNVQACVRLKLNETLEDRIEDAFSAEACTSNSSSSDCYDVIQSSLASLMFEAMWSPITFGLDFDILLSPIKLAAKDMTRKPILRVAAPMAHTMQEALISADLNTSSADASLRRAEQRVRDRKDSALHQLGVRFERTCAAMGVPDAAEGKPAEATRLYGWIGARDASWAAAFAALAGPLSALAAVLGALAWPLSRCWKLVGRRDRCRNYHVVLRSACGSSASRGRLYA